MKKNILFIILTVFMLSGCSAEYSAIYQSIAAESKWDESQRIVINASSQEPALFKLVDDKLYLLIQVSKSGRFFSAVIDYPSWREADINRLLDQHAEIKALIPVDWNDWLAPGYGDECKGK